MKTYKVYLAPGHGIMTDGKRDPGTITKSKITGQTITEHDLNMQIVDYMTDRIKEHNLHAGPTDIRIDLTVERHGSKKGEFLDPNCVGTVKAMEASNYDLGMEVHFDYDKAPKGGFGIWPKRKTKRNIEALCNRIKSKYMVQGLPSRKSYKDVRGLVILRRAVKTDTIIFETDVIADYSQAELMVRGKAIADGIIEWFQEQ